MFRLICVIKKSKPHQSVNAVKNVQVTVELKEMIGRSRQALQPSPNSDPTLI